MPKNLPALPGTIGLAQIGGPGGFIIELGQDMCGAGFKTWEHAFLLLPDGDIIEAEPGGARIVSVDEYADVPVYWCHALRQEITDDQARRVCEQGYEFHGVPYSFLDYFAIFQTRVLHLPPGLLKERLVSTRNMICSQLVVQCYSDAGERLFPKWYPGQVTPLDIYDLDSKLGVK